MIGSITASPPAVTNVRFSHVLLALVALTAVRIWGLHVSTVDLYVDEAQYWAWSRDLAFGYFSKPPLLAWIIAASDHVCGSTEACVRSASPVFYLGTCLVVYAVGRELYGQKTAAWAAISFALATGMSFSSRIISTDVPLLFFWSVALLAYIKLLPGPDWRWAIALGIAFGLGMLAKYAMIYFLLSVTSAAFLDRDGRALLARGQTWLALAIGVLILSPNIYWNLSHDLATFRHTGGNVTGGGLHLRPFGPLEFLASQFAVAGPVVFATFLVVLLRIGAWPTSREDRLMLGFAVPTLALITALAFARSANANWAAPSIVSMTIFAVAWWLRYGSRHALWLTLSIGLIAQIALLAGDAFAYRLTVPPLGRNADLYKRTLGWREFAAHARELAGNAEARTIASEGRSEVAELTYYLRGETVPRSWPGGTDPDNHFEVTQPLKDDAAEPILFISPCPDLERVARFYRQAASLGSFVIRTGPTSSRQFHAFKLSARQQPIGALQGCSVDPS
jgi:4-amino-4-deoxy-L-arabinose transferase-like glycosyltransferase